MVRKATYEDVPELMEVFSKAREIMRASGNMQQWSDGYPSEEIVRKDIEEGVCYVHCGRKLNKTPLWGHSMIIDPWGNIIAQAEWEKEALLVAEIDLDLCDEMRNRLGCMPNRRTDIYRLEEC